MTDKALSEQKFYNDTAKLREEIRTKSEEPNTLLNASDPDPKEVKALQKEISDLRANMAQHRIDFELEARKIAPNGSYARGGLIPLPPGRHTDL